ncbi:BadF/BadG/BcrA/BcrD ATPase family protein [Lipingzhangella sp. LS1_29]|uniref:BadF/BadG/BcrA/BcrD ATPase family protein n=1 Tax=Lipingzhangella rawalii TaxID=2055835 RepID=A0ABU2HB89_9ACTN|nr:BadF/BadG/BcrA/BcrD ATPase family protein [Lipingzhangella rawalii]MDS1272602.1 BadF/BadG/BcrA/BcrD ATPase family protein [Lipingzhangella rawalii]
MTAELVVGIDAGGTSTRCVVVTTAGEIRGRGMAGGANPHSSRDPVGAVRAALSEALGANPCGPIVSGVVGIAGAASRPEETAAVAHQAWSQVGLTGTPFVTDDIVVAYAAGTVASAGCVLVAGTGAVAARIHDFTVRRRADGHGWLVGDEGSAVWLGLAGVRAVLAAWDGRGPETVLTETIPAELAVAPGDAPSMLAAVHGSAPARLGRLAPMVTAAAAGADSVAQGIVDTAAQCLVRTLGAVRPEGRDDGPIVLAGSVLTTDPVGALVRRGLAQAQGSHGAVVAAGPGEFGAAGLALRRVAASAGHARLVETSGGTGAAKTW